MRGGSPAWDYIGVRQPLTKWVAATYLSGMAILALLPPTIQETA